MLKAASCCSQRPYSPVSQDFDSLCIFTCVCCCRGPSIAPQASRLTSLSAAAAPAAPAATLSRSSVPQTNQEAHCPLTATAAPITTSSHHQTDIRHVSRTLLPVSNLPDPPKQEVEMGQQEGGEDLVLAQAITAPAAAAATAITSRHCLCPPLPPPRAPSPRHPPASSPLQLLPRHWVETRAPRASPPRAPR